MKEFLFYIARSGLYLGIFYAFYLLLMRRMTFFRLNRAILLLGSLASGFQHAKPVKVTYTLPIIFQLK